MAAESNTTLLCPRCRTATPMDHLNTPAPVRCPHCGLLAYAAVFPAITRTPEPGKTGDLLLSDAEAGCFYHPNRKAAVACENCGRFLCALCDVELAGRHLCPACIEAGKKKGKIKDLNRTRLLHDEVALALALAPCFVFPITLVTAPTTLVYSFWFWKAPSSIVPRTKVRFVIAMIIAALQIAGWIAFYLLERRTRHGG